MDVKVNRVYKDRLFRLIFSSKEELLALYNAVRDTQYKDAEALEITTLDDVLYMGMKNDLSFLLDDVLNLYEHQSTYCPNMPLRGVFYLADIYRKYVDASGGDLYGSRRLMLPLPQYLVFYNGTAQLPDRMVLKLSESYYLPEGLAAEPSLECSALMLNINLGHNRELMDNCRKLWEYAVFVERIRERLAAGEQLEEAVKQAVDICMKEGVLADILRTQRAEVEELMWAEFNEERFIALEKEYSWEDGNKAGKVKGRAESILEILEELGTVPEELRRRLLEETDLQRLKNWLKEAIKAASIEDFTENMDK
ncbi:MAG: hypothetical protein ACLVAW_20840 [Eisenbergiella massiliensis]